MSLLEIREKMIELQHECTFCAFCLRTERMVAGYDSIKKVTSGITTMLESVTKSPEASELCDLAKEIVPIIQDIIISQEKKNISFLADVLEGELSPLLSDCICTVTNTIPFEEINYFEKNTEALKEVGQNDTAALLESGSAKTVIETSVQAADSGDIFFSIKKECDDTLVNLSSAVNPYRSALEYVVNNTREDVTKYGFAGFGMIYEAMALLRLHYGTRVVIIEENIDFAGDVLTFLDLSEDIRSGRISFSLGKCEDKIAGFVSNCTLLTRLESLMTFDAALRATLNKYRSVLLPLDENKQILFFNFSENVKLGDPYVTDVEERIKDREVYLVAGGPSLTPCYDILKKRPEGSIILCVATSAAKLIAEGIDPEFAVLLDGLPSTKKQMNCSFNYERTSFIYLATACHESVAMFEGKRYIVCQEGFQLSEQMTQVKGGQLFKTGGSVATLALDLAVRLGAKKITCLGLDLAYTYDQLHATGIDEVEKIKNDDLNLQVRDTKGNLVYTSLGLNAYREWIERYISVEDNLPPMVNISDGAFINGMQNVRVNEYKV